MTGALPVQTAFYSQRVNQKGDGKMLLPLFKARFNRLLNEHCVCTQSLFHAKKQQDKGITGTKDNAEGRTVSMLRNKRPGMHFINLFKVRQ